MKVTFRIDLRHKPQFHSLTLSPFFIKQRDDQPGRPTAGRIWKRFGV